MRNLFSKYSSFFLLSVWLTAGAAVEQHSFLPPVLNQLTPTARHANLDQTVARLLSFYHYRQHKLDDHMSTVILDNYIEALDFNRSYFFAGDIAAFRKKYTTTLDNHLLSGNLQPAYEIFNIYQRRLQERTKSALEYLHHAEIDFTIDESLNLDRKEAPWATNRTELDEIWRKRLKNELLTLVLAGKDLPDARKTLEKRYEGQLHRTAQTNSDDVFQLYMNAVSSSFDPHSAYFSPRISENFNIQMRLSLEGIGTVLRMEEERIQVVELVPGGPADLSQQINPEDAIIGVGQGDHEPMVDIIGWRLDDVVDLIRGPRGSVVRLQVVPANASADHVGKTVRLVRDTIKLENQAAKSDIKTFPAGDQKIQIGIITIPTFYSDFAAAQRGDKNYRSTTRDVRHLLRELKHAKVDGIVIDLRQNGGGSLQEAVELTGLFIEEGPVVQVRSSNGNIEIENDPDPDLLYNGPLAVLVDRFSASASEIFAGAIQDYGRGIVLGDPTFGKGTVQTLIDLKRFVPNAKGPVGQLKLTVAKFYRVNGSSTQHRGVTPDITFPAAFDSDEVGESSQDYALPWDEIKPIRYQSSHGLNHLIPKLKKRYQARTATDPVFNALLKDFVTAKQIREKTSVSLLMSQRKAEWEKTKAQQLQEENRQRLAQGLAPLEEGEDIAEQTTEEQPDPLLDESARILVDMIDLLNEPGNAKALVMNEGASVH